MLYLIKNEQFDLHDKPGSRIKSREFIWNQLTNDSIYDSFSKNLNPDNLEKIIDHFPVDVDDCEDEKVI